MVATRQAATSAAREVGWLEGIGNSCAEEVARVVVGDNRAAREEDPVAQRERDVAGDLPVEEDVRLEAEVTLAVERGLVDRGVDVELAVDEQVDADLKAVEGAVLGQRERQGSGAEDQDVGGRGGDGESRVQQR